MADAFQHSARQSAGVTMPFAPVMILVRSNQMLFHFECALCDIAFSSNQQLVYHVNCQHDLPKPYRCGYCKNSYVRNSQLVRHLRARQCRPCEQQVQLVLSQPAATLCGGNQQQENGVFNSAHKQEKTCSNTTISPGIAGEEGLGGDTFKIEYISTVVENSTATHVTVSDVDNDVPAVVGSSTALPTAPSEEPHLLQREQQQPANTQQKQSGEDLAKSDSENEDTTLEDAESENEDTKQATGHNTSHSQHTEHMTPPSSAPSSSVGRNTTPEIICPYCNLHMTTRQALFKHKRRKHRELVSLQTKACRSSSSVMNGSNLQCHSEAVSTSMLLRKKRRARRTRSQKVPSEAEKSPYIKSYKPVMCQYCGLWLKRTYNLKQHIRRKHVMELDHKCSLCESAFKTKSSLRLHMITHSGEKPFVCEVCGKSFPRNAYLTTHKHIHTNAKPFECNICHKRFNGYAQVNQCKRRHSGVKRYSCDICGQKFMFSKRFNRHKLSHSDLRPVSCHLCDKSYKDKSCLRPHMKRVHPHS